MGNVKFHLRKGNTIYLVYWHNGTRFVYSTGVKVNHEEWNPKDNRVVKRKGRSDLAQMNSVLDRYQHWVSRAEGEIILSGQNVTNKLLKTYLDRYSGKVKENGNSFVAYGRKVIERYKASGKSVAPFETTIKHVEKYKKDITFSEINLDFYARFTAQLKDKNYSKNFIGKIMGIIKQIMNMAIEEGLTDNMSIKSRRFKRESERVYNIYLTVDELKKIQKAALPRYLDDARDLFLIGAFTGLRFSDYSKLKRVNFEGGEFVVQDTTKVEGRIIIPQHPIVKAILKKRNGELPKALSNQKLNAHLKLIGQAAGLKQEVIKTRTEGRNKVTKVYKKYELITTHTARRSLATNMYLAGVPVNMIMILTGHKRITQLMEYIKITEIEAANTLKNHPFFK
jgi:integrase